MAAPVNPANGDYITRGLWVREVTSRWEDLYDPWQSYTPNWTAASGSTSVGVGGSLTGSYKLFGSLAVVRIRLIIGVGPSLGSGSWSISLPPGATPAADQTITGWISNQAGSVRHPVSGYLTAAGGVERLGVFNNIVSQSVPFGWANQDQMVLGGEYECA